MQTVSSAHRDDDLRRARRRIAQAAQAGAARQSGVWVVKTTDKKNKV